MLASRIKKGEVSRNQSRTRKNFSVKSVFSKRFCGAFGRLFSTCNDIIHKCIQGIRTLDR